MENKYTKYFNISLDDNHYDTLVNHENDSLIGAKWLIYLLMGTALMLWVVFNIVSIQSNLLPPYLLVVMNLILYFIIAIMINPDSSSD